MFIFTTKLDGCGWMDDTELHHNISYRIPNMYVAFKNDRLHTFCKENNDPHKLLIASIL